MIYHTTPPSTRSALERRFATALVRFLVGSLLVAALTVPLHAAEEKHAFNLPAGDATQTLKQFAAQAKTEIVFSSDMVEGVRTQAVQGEFTTHEAIRALLANTGLAITQDQKTGALAVKRAPSPNAHWAAQSTKSVRPEETTKQDTILVRMDKITVTGSRLALNAGEKPMQPVLTFWGPYNSGASEDEVPALPLNKGDHIPVGKATQYYVTMEDVGFPFEKIKVISDGSGKRAGLNIGWIKVAMEGAAWDDPNAMTTFYLNCWLADKEGLTYTQDNTPATTVATVENGKWELCGMPMRKEIDHGQTTKWSYSISTTTDYEKLTSRSVDTFEGADIKVGVSYKTLTTSAHVDAEYLYSKRVKTSVEEKYHVSQTVAGKYAVQLKCPDDVGGGFYQVVNLRYVTKGSAVRGQCKFEIVSAEGADQYVRTFFWAKTPTGKNEDNDIYSTKAVAEAKLNEFRAGVDRHKNDIMSYLTGDTGTSDKNSKTKPGHGGNVKKS